MVRHQAREKPRQREDHQHQGSMNWFAILLVACVLPALSAAESKAFTSRVVGVHDGDTITVLAEGNVEVRVRLDGIDAPETKQAFGERSRQTLSAIVAGKTAKITSKGKDRYGRTIGVVFVGGVNANLAMVQAGMAWRYDKYSKDAALLAAQNEARAARLGLWADANPVPPWEWRAARKK
jgi:endonuclease YncB( thermonuclease family)